MPRLRRNAHQGAIAALLGRHSAHRPRRATTPPRVWHGCEQRCRPRRNAHRGAMATLLGRHSAHKPRQATTTDRSSTAVGSSATAQEGLPASGCYSAAGSTQCSHRPRQAATPPTGLAQLLMALGLQPRKNVHRGAIAALLGRHSAHKLRRATTPPTGSSTAVNSGCHGPGGLRVWILQRSRIDTVLTSPGRLLHHRRVWHGY